MQNECRCYRNGNCDYCLEKCTCVNGYGSDNDIVAMGRGLDGMFTLHDFFPEIIGLSNPVFF